MYFVYIIQSCKDDSYYIGQTNKLEKRIEQHNQGKSSYTKSKAPWRLRYFEKYDTRSEAMNREKEIKRMKSREFIEKLLEDAGGRPD